MFYQPELSNHGLPHAPFKSLIVPRPIAWISTLGTDGRVNLAPFSQFNIIGWSPARLMFSAGNTVKGNQKDSVVNAEQTGEFVVNLATYDLRRQVAQTAALEDSPLDEMAAVGLTAAPSTLVKPPRVQESPVQLECRYEQTICFPNDEPGNIQSMVIGRVVGIHIDDRYITPEGRVDIVKLRPLARMGYLDYTSVTEVFEIDGVETIDLAGMAGGR